MATQRLDSKLERPELVHLPPHCTKTKSELISYEDLLVTQYLENLKRQKTVTVTNVDNQNRLQIPLSPYLKSQHRRYQRPGSAVSSRYSSRPKIDEKFIADHNLWEPATPRQPQRLRPASAQRLRPASAPVKHNRPQSGISHRSRPLSGHRVGFKKQPYIIKVTAYVNGSREKCVNMAAPTIKILCEMATEKLGLPFAARRVFLEEGVEVFSGQDIPQYQDVYISMGENFKDPYHTAQRNVIIRNKSVWSLGGVILPEQRHTKGRRTLMSKRMRTLCENKKVRIIIYKNGSSTDPAEVVADLKNMTDFLNNCTGKLNLRNHAKLVYDWNGQEILDLADTPMLDDTIIPQGKTPLLGPLWISAGERYSPSGTQGFLLLIQTGLREKLKAAKKQKKDVDLVLNNTKDEVKDTLILSMSTEELYEASDKLDEKIETYKSTLETIREKMEALKEETSKEEEQGMNYRMTHIKELSSEDRLVGTKGIKLKVFENGKVSGEFIYYFNLREAMKGADREKAMLRLLDELSASRFSAGVHRNLNSVATRLYTKDGGEITDIYKLQPDQSVWLSFGEPFICPFTYVLNLFVERATQVLDAGGAERIVRENLSQSPDGDLTKDLTKWEAAAGFPADYDSADAARLQFDPDKIESLLQFSEIDRSSHFLINKEKRTQVLYAELGVAEKTHSKYQIFVFTESGHIYCKAAPQLCLAVLEERAEFKIQNTELNIEGFVVGMQKKMPGNSCQIWQCLPDATICCQAYPNLLLTHLGNKRSDFEDQAPHNKTKTGGIVSLMLTEPLPKKQKSPQRFALKQERLDNLGQWKFTETSNQEWKKLAYSWPVTASGQLNKQYDWPMEGYLIPNAPPIRKSDKKLGLSGVTPARLRVLKNGERNFSLAVSVVGPNISNLVKDNTPESKSKEKPELAMLSAGTELHCMEMSVLSMEFQMFLDHCTSLLDLPFAARRLFDAEGKELFHIQNLERDALVYVSCGEEWSNPQYSKEEQSRRFLLSQLTSDVVKIQQFCSMRNPENFVLEISGPVAPGSELVVNKDWLHQVPQDSRQEQATLSGRSAQQFSQYDEEDENIADSSHVLTSHERAHMRSDEYANNLKWPWERLVNVNNSLDTEDPEAQRFTDRDLYEKFKPQSTPHLSQESLQKFAYEDGYISVACNKALVLSICHTDGRMARVILAKRHPDDIHQRWTLRENGEISARHNQHMVLSVSMPATATGSSPSQSFTGCPIVLQARCTNMFGKAHQRWRYDAESGLINAFYTELPDKEITAANRADVCTYAIVQGVDIDQPGYLVEMSGPGEKAVHLKVCVSCARAMRGRFKVEQLPANTRFHCAMGDAKRRSVRQIGSLKVLQNKVDLSTHEAELTLSSCRQMLEELKQQTSVKTIKKKINSIRSVQMVKVMAYKNGEGRLRKGEIICGSSVEGILSQCGHRLGLTSAARRMYLEDGTIVLGVEELVRHAVDNCRAEMVSLLQQRDKPVAEEKDELAQLEQLHSAAILQVTEQMQRSAERLQDINRITQEEEESSEQKEDLQQKDVDREEAQKMAREQELMLKGIKLPPLDVILRAPIEVWISSGKAFISPDVVESKEENRRKKRNFRAQVSLALDIEKHVLRQMRGRRLEQMEPGVYKSTLSSTQPVVLEKHWQEPTVEEMDKHHAVHKLQSHLSEIRAYQSEKNSSFSGIKLDGRLYQQPNMKRVLVYPNGESVERSIYVWGSSLEEILDNATFKLSLRKQAKIIYTVEGQRVQSFDEIQRDQLLCVSTGKSFMQMVQEKVNIEVKANWGRARKQYGSKATDVVVQVQKNARVDVDPFGPPLLALPECPADCGDSQ
ncbi:doublecortin domain-containing protein 1-like [Physella acuta]|uniref:doublecortin domain-containing protein 1-like n=1 Tax=Physella acuta TaxID=109671 RepID=UPI0027DC3F4A|nr:doublecortin domain-containing protein 1-like [Physella acuta]